MTQSGGSSQFATGWALLGLARRRRQARPGRARLRPARARIAARDRRRRAHRARRPRRRAGPAPLRRAQPDLGHPAPPPPRRLLRRLRQLHVVRDLRAAPLGRRAASSARSASAARWIERHQNSDGGFNVGGRGASGIDDTASAVQALRARRPDRGARGAARRSSPRQQNANGGFPLTRGARAERAVDGLRRPGPGGRGRARVRGAPRPGLPALADGANGLVRYSRTGRQTPVWVSAQALLALHRRPF